MRTSLDDCHDSKIAVLTPAERKPRKEKRSVGLVSRCRDHVLPNLRVERGPRDSRPSSVPVLPSARQRDVEAGQKGDGPIGCFIDEALVRKPAKHVELPQHVDVRPELVVEGLDQQDDVGSLRTSGRFERRCQARERSSHLGDPVRHRLLIAGGEEDAHGYERAARRPTSGTERDPPANAPRTSEYTA